MLAQSRNLPELPIHWGQSWQTQSNLESTQHWATGAAATDAANCY